MELGPGLLPMMPHREDMVFLQGLYNQTAAVSTSPHLGRMNVLSGAPVSLDPNEIRVGTSMDQIIASQIGGRTTIPSLVLGIEPNELRLEDGLSMIYGSSVSWISPTKPATKELYPSRAFDRLVGDGTGRMLDRSILDEVRRDSQSLRPKISRGDNEKLSEYLESIRDIEKRIERASKEERIEGWRPTLAQPDMPRPANELPQNVPDHMKLMLDLIVLAFQMDRTRVATLMLNNDLSQMNFKFLEGVQGALHLDLTHNGRAADKEAMYLKTNQYHIAQFAYLTQRMKEISEGETHAPRQLDPDGHVQPVRRRCPRRQPAAVPAHRQGRRDHQDRPHPRLPREGRRRPEGVQPAPVAHGSHGRHAGPLRRRDHAAGRVVVFRPLPTETRRSHIHPEAPRPTPGKMRFRQ